MAAETNSIASTERQLVTFLLGSDEFGADIMDVKEIIRIPYITKVPNAPSYVEGACNLRGNVLPVIDGRTMFNMERKTNDENSRIMVIDVDGKPTGVIVDKVSEVIRVSTGDIEQTPRIVRNVDADYLNGVVKLNNGNRLIMLLDIVSILSVSNSENERSKTDDHLQKVEIIENNVHAQSIEEEHLVSFLLDREEYAIGIMKVNEIIRVPQIVKVPNCEEYMEGVVSIRNNLLPIINMRTYFGMTPRKIDDHTRILVVDMGGSTVGIMVDKISEVLRVPTSLIQPPPRFSSQSKEQLVGIAKLNNGKRMILILEPLKLVSAEEISAFTKADEMTNQNDSKKEDVGQVVDEEQFVTFKIGIEEYGIRIDNVQEINRMTEATKIPRAPYCIDGIVNLRGNIIPALDLRKLFHLSEKQVTDATRIIIVDFESKKTGIVVDSVSEVLRLLKTSIEEPPEVLSNGADSAYVEGVGKLDGGKRMILILDIGKVLSFC